MPKYRHVLCMIAFTLLGKYSASPLRPDQRHTAECGSSQNPVVIALESLGNESIVQSAQGEYPTYQFLSDCEGDKKPQAQNSGDALSVPDSFETSAMEVSHTEASSGDATVINSRSTAGPKHLCPVCNKPFTRRGNMKIHLRTMHSLAPQPPAPWRLHPCTLAGCNASYKNKRDLKINMEKPHTGSPPKPYPCKVVGCKSGGYAEKDKLVRHMKDVHGENLPTQYECKTCRKLFSSQSDIYDHRTREHEKALKCEVCAQVFANQLDLNAHRAMNLNAMPNCLQNCINPAGSSGKPYKCREKDCPKAYAGSSGLWQHTRRRHPKPADLNNTQSSQVPRTCASTNNVVSGGTKVCNDTQQHAPQMCQICNIQYPDLASFVTHITKKHRTQAAAACASTLGISAQRDPVTVVEVRNNIQGAQLERYTCGSCGNVFPSIDAMMEHMNTSH